MDTITSISISWGIFLVNSSRMPEAKLLIIRVSNRLKEVYNTPRFRTSFQVACFESVS
jgi:hypothetical protein